MRKLIAILFLTAYFNVAWGAAISVHFCCGHLSGISFSGFSNHNSEGCKTKSVSPDCCKDQVLQAKTDITKTADNTNLQENNFTPLLHIYPDAAEHQNYTVQTNPSVCFKDFRNHFPKNKFLIYCNLRI